jgi:hypothetical protein
VAGIDNSKWPKKLSVSNPRNDSAMTIIIGGDDRIGVWCSIGGNVVDVCCLQVGSGLREYHDAATPKSSKKSANERRHDASFYNSVAESFLAHTPPSAQDAKHPARTLSLFAASPGPPIEELCMGFPACMRPLPDLI